MIIAKIIISSFSFIANFTSYHPLSDFSAFYVCVGGNGTGHTLKTNIPKSLNAKILFVTDDTLIVIRDFLLNSRTCTSRSWSLLFFLYRRIILCVLRTVVEEKIMETPTAHKPQDGSSSTFKGDFSSIEKILEKYSYKKSNLIAILQAVQEECRYVPEEVMTYIGSKIPELSPATVYGVATFYSQFSLEPKGKYVVKVCDGTACHVRGSMPVYNAVVNRLNLKDGVFTTADGLFTVETVSCLGACGLAPVVVINEKVYPQMTADAMLIVINALLDGKEEV